MIQIAFLFFGQVLFGILIYFVLDSFRRAERARIDTIIKRLRRQIVRQRAETVLLREAIRAVGVANNTEVLNQPQPNLFARREDREDKELKKAVVGVNSTIVRPDGK